MTNFSHAEFDKMAKDQSFKSYKRQDLKLGYKLKLDIEKNYIDRRMKPNILKLVKNNQHGYAMTKPLPVALNNRIK